MRNFLNLGLGGESSSALAQFTDVFLGYIYAKFGAFITKIHNFLVIRPYHRISTMHVFGKKTICTVLSFLYI